MISYKRKVKALTNNARGLLAKARSGKPTPFIRSILVPGMVNPFGLRKD